MICSLGLPNLFLCPVGPVAIASTAQVHQEACLPLTQPKTANDMADRLSLRLRLQKFFESNSFSARLSRACSATICFKRRFSSSRAFSLFSSLTVRPAYLAFQFYFLASLLPFISLFFS